HHQAMAWLLFKVADPALADRQVEVAGDQVNAKRWLAVFVETATTITKQLPTATKTWLSANRIETRLHRMSRLVLLSGRPGQVASVCAPGFQLQDIVEASLARDQWSELR